MLKILPHHWTNSSRFIFSTTHLAGSRNFLTAIIASDEIKTTLTPAMETVMQVLTSGAYYGKGASTAPMVVIIDATSQLRRKHSQGRAWFSARILSVIPWSPEAKNMKEQNTLGWKDQPDTILQKFLSTLISEKSWIKDIRLCHHQI